MRAFGDQQGIVRLADGNADSDEKAGSQDLALVRNTPRSRSVPVFGLIWLSTKLIVP